MFGLNRSDTIYRVVPKSDDTVSRVVPKSDDCTFRVVPKFDGTFPRIAPQHMYKTIFIAVCLLLASIPSSAFAQRTDTTGAVLPDISPREVEIRGQLEISFPSLQRQPLIGFNPPPRVPELSETRRPFIEQYKLASADLPNTPLGQPDPPDVNSLTDVDAVNGELEASAGRYLSRILRAHLSGSLSSRSALYSRVVYNGSEGHILRDEETDLRNPFDALDAMLGYQNIGPRAGWGIELDGGIDSYTLFGTNLLENDSLSSQVVLPDRSGITGGASFWARSQAEAAFNTDFRLRYNGTRYETDLFDATLTELSPLTRKERRLTSELGIGVPFSLGSFYVTTKLSGAGLDNESLFDFTTYYLDLGSGFDFEISPQLHLRVGGRYLATSLMDAGQDEFTSYLTGDARLSLFPTAGLKLYVRNQPGLTPNHLWGIFRTNPYVVDRPTMQASLRPIDAEAGFNWFTGNVQLAARVGYMQSPNFQYFENEADSPDTGYNYRRGIFTIGYQDAEILTIAGDLSLVILRGLHAKFGVAYRDGELTETKEHIPYFSPLVSENMISYKFHDNRMLIQALASYYGSRYRNRAEDVEIDDYFDLDFLYSYQLSNGIGLIARLDNVLGANLEHWEHYPESPFTLSLGFRVLW